MKITFELSHKYIAIALEDRIKPYVPTMAKETLGVEVDAPIETLTTRIIAHWKELRHKLAEDTYTCHFYHPATPWQHFKQEYLPKWFVKRYPVVNKKYTRTVNFTRYATYPMADVKLPKTYGTLFIEDIVKEQGA